MVLVDEKLLDYQPMLQHFQVKQETQPTEQTVKSSINEDMRSTLDNPSIPEDVKVKHYSKQLNRYLNTKRKLPDPDLTPMVVDDLLDLKSDIKPEARKSTRNKRDRNYSIGKSGSDGNGLLRSQQPRLVWRCTPSRSIQRNARQSGEEMVDDSRPLYSAQNSHEKLSTA